MKLSTVLLVTLATFGGCHCSDETSTKSSASSNDQASGSDGAKNTRRNRKQADPNAMSAKPMNRPQVQSQPLDANEINGLMPAAPGDVMVPFAIGPGGKQAHGSWCVAATDAAGAADALKKTFTDKGWQKVTTRGTGQTIGLSGEHDGYHLAIVIRGNDSATCPQSQGKFATNLTVFRLGIPAPMPNMLPPPTPPPAG